MGLSPPLDWGKASERSDWMPEPGGSSGSRSWRTRGTTSPKKKAARKRYVIQGKGKTLKRSRVSRDCATRTSTVVTVTDKFKAGGVSHPEVAATTEGFFSKT